MMNSDKPITILHKPLQSIERVKSAQPNENAYGCLCLRQTTEEISYDLHVFLRYLIEISRVSSNPTINVNKCSVISFLCHSMFRMLGFQAHYIDSCSSVLFRIFFSFQRMRTLL